ncbi:MAG: ABC transporter ATP-binding protein [Chitinophagales bacterium]|nr:ABC transporter ATP-binding protein [Chitinophagales bacterium]MDW8419438.1 ABC transporter ATP-binding protein [Chitinophagales bacterium]
MPPVIKAERLSKRFLLSAANQNHSAKELWALRDVTFEIYEGQQIGIIGSNGSGKSTLLRILAGVLRPTAGNVTIRGRVAGILDIGSNIHPELSGRENILLTALSNGFNRKDARRYSDAIVDFSGLEQFIDEPVKNYSNGMYLRLAFSIFTHIPYDIYLFDEVISAGDAEFSVKLKNKLEEIKKQHATVLLVSHNMSELAGFETFIQLEQGRLVSITRDVSLLNTYTELGLEKNNITIHRSNVFLNNLEEKYTNLTATLHDLKLYQHESNELASDKPTHIEFHFTKHDNSVNLLPVISIADTFGNTILASSPFLEKNVQVTRKGSYTVKATFPPKFFGYQTYRLSITLLPADVDYTKPDTFATDNLHHNNYILSADAILHFKVKLVHYAEGVNTEKLLVRGGIMPDLNWKIEPYEN